MHLCARTKKVANAPGIDNVARLAHEILFDCAWLHWETSVRLSALRCIDDRETSDVGSQLADTCEGECRWSAASIDDDDGGLGGAQRQKEKSQRVKRDGRIESRVCNFTCGGSGIALQSFAFTCASNRLLRT
jgi:hypothetical protein